MHFEDLLKEIGSFGLYQRLLCFLLIPFTTGVVAFTFYVQLFVLTAPPHTCRQVAPQDAGQATQDLYNQISHHLNATPFDMESKLVYTCHEFDPNVTSDYLAHNARVNVTSLDQLPFPTVECTSDWEYDHDVMFSSYTSEHDWVCNDAWRPYMVVTLFWVGNTVGSWLWGIMSDTCGRRPTIVLSLLVYGVAGVASVFVSDFYAFTALRFLVGFSHHTVTHLPFVLVMEYCGVESRVVPLLTIMMSYTLASIIAPALAWLMWDWSVLILMSAVPSVLMVLAFKLIPESASWLIARGKSECAREQLQTVAKVNGFQLPHAMVTQLLYDGKSESQAESKNESRDGVDQPAETSRSILQAVKYPSLRKNILLVLLVWMMGCMCYYGHCQNTAHLGSNIFTSYLLGAVVEIPSWCVPWLIHRFGRRRPLTSAFLLSGLAGFVYAFVPADMEWLILTLALVGRATITGAYYITLQYGPEVFPTVVRGQGVALSETLGGVAIFLSPSIVYLGEIQRRAPLLVFAGLSVLAGAATVLLPETGGVTLPNTLPQAEQFSRQAARPCCKSNDDDDDVEGKAEAVSEADL